MKMCTIKSTDETSDNSSSSDSDDSISSGSSISSDSDDETDDTPESEEPAVADTSKEGREDEDEEEDEVVKAIRAEKEKVSEHPPDIKSDDFIVNISFHPASNVVAAALITGDVVMYRYSNEETEVMNTLELHTKACRDIEFSEDGDTLFSCSKDKCIMLTDVNTGKLKNFYDTAHEASIYRLLVMDNNKFASGDEDGTVKLWDVRKKDAVFSLKEMDDYVTSMVTTQAQKYLVCLSGDGTLTSLDMRKRRLYVQSEPYEHELTCMATLRNETKLIVGSANGTFYVFNWGEFGYHNDLFPMPKREINCLLPITEDIVVYSGEDGVIRGLQVFPKKQLGLVGQHQMAVDSLDISFDGQFIASCSHDHTIRFWNINYFREFSVVCKKNNKKEFYHNLPSSKGTNAADFFSGLI